jgi:hypothetical protein
VVIRDQDTSIGPQAIRASTSLQEGEHTDWDLPNRFRLANKLRFRCLPHRKHDMVAVPLNEFDPNGEPETLAL